MMREKALGNLTTRQSAHCLVLFAGPNGTGKSIFIYGILRERAEAFQFVNPDAVSLSRRERA